MCNHNWLFTWVLGIRTQEQALLPTEPTAQPTHPSLCLEKVSCCPKISNSLAYVSEALGLQVCVMPNVFCFVFETDHTT